MRKLFNIICFATIACCILTSCGKEWELQGRWNFDVNACTQQIQYTDSYRDFCPDSIPHVDTVIYNPSNLFSGYWDFTNSYFSYYYKYLNGNWRQNSTIPFKVDDDILIIGDKGKDYYNILTLDNNKLVVQYADTTYFYDENYIKKIAFTDTYTYVLNKD